MTKMNELTKMEEKESDKRVIEIAGIKMEVDMRHVKKIENYKVGTNIRILKKASYGEGYDTYAGVIIGFEEFKSRPSILIAYLKTSYNNAEIEFLTFNKSTKDTEICIAEDTFIPFQKSTILEKLNNEIVEKKNNLLEAKAKKEYFLKYFDKYFEEDTE